MRPAAALLTATLLVTPATPTAAATPAVPPGTALRWGLCPTPKAPSALQCATLDVPMDYTRPHGRQITVTISRLPATDPGLRRGVLLTNPGGPGAAGLLLPAALAGDLPPPVRQHYDLIGFDPRGVGHSSPVTCGLTPPPGNLLYPYPGRRGSLERNIAYARTTAAACARHGGPLLPHVTTANTARDMDRIRAALGEPRISYLGWSYGTYLGAVYRQLFADRVDRMILDSAIDPRRVWYEQYRTMSPAADRRLDDLTAWIAGRHDQYQLGTTPHAVRRHYLRLAARLDRKPVTRADGVVVTGAILRADTFRALYHDDLFATIAERWRHPAAVPPPPTIPTDPAVPADNTTAALYGVVCGDIAWPRDISRYRAAVRDDRRRWPATDGMPANIWPCAFWHRPPTRPPVPITRSGPRNTLIVQNLRDPATPATGGMRTTLGPGAVEVTVNAGGHGVLGGGSCADHHALTYLIEGTLPDTDQTC